jgi:hypothetical protein
MDRDVAACTATRAHSCTEQTPDNCGMVTADRLAKQGAGPRTKQGAPKGLGGARRRRQGEQDGKRGNRKQFFSSHFRAPLSGRSTKRDRLFMRSNNISAGRTPPAES